MKSSQPLGRVAEMLLTRGFSLGLLLLVTGCLPQTSVLKQVHVSVHGSSPSPIASSGPVTPAFPNATLRLSVGPSNATQHIRFGQRLLSSRGDKIVTITNIGDQDATGLLAEIAHTTFGFKDWGFPGNGGTCSDTLAAKQSCDIALSFVPVMLGNASADLIIRFFNGEQDIEMNVPLSGKGVQIVSLVSGGSHSCAILDDGSLSCWGANDRLQSGSAEATSRLTEAATVAINGSVSSISASASHTCALHSDSTVSCWGANSYGQTGEEHVGGDHANPVAISLQGPAVSVSAGKNHSCAVLENGSIQCWGANDQGQLGNGVAGNSASPVNVSGIQNAVSIASGDHHSCAVLTTGEVACWGANEFGQVGAAESLGSVQSLPALVPVNGIERVVAASAHTCALRNDGKLLCWGSNRSGQLGTGSLEDSVTPAILSGLKWVADFAAGGDNTCAIDTSGSLKCWGANDQGQLGIGEAGAPRTTPTYFWSSYDSLAIAVGNGTICTYEEDGSIECAGASQAGQLGPDQWEPVSYPLVLSISF